MRVFTALLIDAYRQLNAKKLFWITLAISGLVVVAYASIGFNESGMTMFFGLMDIESEFLNESSPLARMLYRSIFASFILAIWLAWIATILALISTATIFPDFLAEGSVDLVLSKPIRRSTMFFIKYLTSLLFVVLQVSLFCVGVFLCMGWRLGDWNWLIFAAIPIVTIFYSYLYSITVLVGVITRSALTALLLTMLFWFSLFSINLTEGILNQASTMIELSLEDDAASIAAAETQLELMRQTAAPGEEPDMDGARRRLEQRQDERAETESTLGKVERWHDRVRWVQAVLPKTEQTINLLDRWLREDTDVNIMDIFSGNIRQNPQGEYVPRESDREREVFVQTQEEYEAKSAWYIIGSSLAFEAVVLAIACVIFVRRDY